MNTEFKSQLYFDGDCRMCSAFAQIASNNSSSNGLECIDINLGSNLNPQGEKTIEPIVDAAIYKRKGESFFGVEAIEQLLLDTKFPYQLLGYLSKLFPLQLKKWVYSWVAKNRRRWFGRISSNKV